MYTWVKFLRVLGAFAFVRAHGASASVALRLQREKSLGRIRAMPDLSAAFLGVVYAAIGILLGAAIVAAFAGHWWGRGWTWLSLVLAVAMAVGMSLLGTVYYCDRSLGIVGADAPCIPWCDRRGRPGSDRRPDGVQAVLAVRLAVVTTWSAVPCSEESCGVGGLNCGGIQTYQLAEPVRYRPRKQG